MGRSKYNISLLSLNSLYKVNKYKPYVQGHGIYNFFYNRYLAYKKLRKDISTKKYKMILYDVFVTLFPEKYYQTKDRFNPENNDKEINYIFDNKNNIKTVVYTSVFGNYDSIKEPLYASQDVDYIAITDSELPDNSVWKKYDYSKIENFNEMDDYHKSKYCKMFPNAFFKEYDMSVWVDGNVQIIGDLLPFVDRTKNTIAMFDHPINNEIFEEKDSILYYGKAKKEEIIKQVDFYKRNGFPKKYGMKECSIIVRKHNDRELIKIMTDWWNQVNTFTMRDQISLPYVLWINGKDISYIQSLGPNWRWNVRLHECEHIR